MAFIKLSMGRREIVVNVNHVVDIEATYDLPSIESKLGLDNNTKYNNIKITMISGKVHEFSSTDLAKINEIRDIIINA